MKQAPMHTSRHDLANVSNLKRTNEGFACAEHAQPARRFVNFSKSYVRLLLTAAIASAIALPISVANGMPAANAQQTISQDTIDPASQERFLEAFALVQQGLELIGTGDSASAVTAFDESLDISREIGELQLQSIALIGKGKALVELGNAEDARASLQDGLTIAQDLGDPELTALAEGVLAEID
jgi:tetratricopeptide (TPR) repeat protein